MPTLPTISEPLPGEQQAADEFGASLLAFRLFVASGFPISPVDKYIGETAPTLLKLGKHFGVSERTAAAWKAKGLPTTADGRYPLASAIWWKREQPVAEDWLETGNRKLTPRRASGDLARAILRVFRVDVPDAAQRARKGFMAAMADVDPSDDAAVAQLFDDAVSRHFGSMILTDEQIENLLVETWEIV